MLANCAWIGARNVVAVVEHRRCVLEILRTGDIVPFNHRTGLVPGQLPGGRLWIASADQVQHRRAPELMRDGFRLNRFDSRFSVESYRGLGSARQASLMTGSTPGLP